MSGDVVLRQGDLIEYTRPMRGRPDLPGEMTVRAVVRGFTVIDGDRSEGHRVSVWLHEGAVQFGEPEEGERAGAPTVETEVRQDKEPELIGYGLGHLLELEPEVVSPGNSPRDLGNFEVGR